MHLTISDVKKLMEQSTKEPWKRDPTAVRDEWYGFYKALNDYVSVWSGPNEWTEESQRNFELVSALPDIAALCIELDEQLTEARKKEREDIVDMLEKNWISLYSDPLATRDLVIEAIKRRN